MLAIWAFKAPLIAAGAGAGLAALGYMFYKDRKAEPREKAVTFKIGPFDPTHAPESAWDPIYKHIAEEEERAPASPTIPSAVATPDVLAISQNDWDILTSHIK